MPINNVKAGEIHVSFFEKKMKVKAAFVDDKKTGVTHGYTTHEAWSKETLFALEALKQAIERDLRKVHFDIEEGAAATGSGPVEIEDLGEWVGDDGKPA